MCSRLPLLLATIAGVVALGGSVIRAGAQAPPSCSGAQGGLLYYIPQNTSTIYVYDPALAISATNPSASVYTLPTGSDALAICPNVNATAPTTTFYTIANGTYHYYNGTGWTNTGHSAGHAYANSIAGGGGYIYSLDGVNGNIYQYNGTGNATLLLSNFGFNSIPGGGNPFDLVADCSGNFYVIVQGNPYALRKYSPAGVLLQSWTVTGIPALGNVVGGIGGLAIIGGTVYIDNLALSPQGGAVLTGTLGPTSVNLTSSSFPAFYFPFDFASCPIGSTGTTVQASIDTAYYCGTGPSIPISANGATLFSWSVISGPAVITGSGSSVTVTALATSQIRVYGTDAGVGCSGDADTVTIIVPTATVDAGPPSTSVGCGVYTDTLTGTLTGTTQGVTYNLGWSPASSIVSGATTLTPIVSPATTTTYTLTVSTPTDQGGCVFRDSTVVSVVTVSVDAGFSHTIRYGCIADTVAFINNSITSQGTMWYEWDFGDGTTSSLQNPVHVYTTNGTYTVGLIAHNGNCSDTALTTIPINHFLAASFSALPDDSLCGADTVLFQNTSTASIVNGIAPRYLWQFGDGSTDTAANPRHYYPVGTYFVTLSVRDFVPCTDTVRDTIVVDPVPTVQLDISDTSLCVGEAILLAGEASAIGSTGLVWTFGDGSFDTSNSAALTHGYDQAGLYAVTLSATYRICLDKNDTVQVRVNPYPIISLGPDTSICPSGEPLVLFARMGDGGSAQIVWNTGDTAASILIRHQGEYWARATSEGGCHAADTVQVQKGCYLDIPNVFTPNGDGVNDYFLPREVLSDGVARFTMSIYNRWSQKIWEITRVDGRGWDGKFNGVNQPAGAYIYLIEVELSNGYRERYQGNMTLLR